jgi:hypothetical protein
VSKPFLAGTDCTEIECGELSVMYVLENKRGEMEVLDCVSQACAGIRQWKIQAPLALGPLFVETRTDCFVQTEDGIIL